MYQKRKSKTAFLCFLLCLPLFLIAYLVITYATERLDPKDIKSVEMITPDGVVTKSEKYEDIEFFVDIFLNSSKLSSPLRDTESAEYVQVNLDRDDSILRYRIYPELSETGCMFSSPDGKYHLISKEDARAMLSRPVFAFLYKASSLPDLIITSGTLEKTVLPESYGWYYRMQDGSYTEYNDTPLSESSEVFSIYSDRVNSLSFTRKPDNMTVSITDPNGQLLPVYDISSLIFSGDTLLNVTIVAEWNRTGDSNCHGSASYSFDMLYDVPAVLSVSDTNASIGGSVVINVKHLNDNETVTLTSELELGELHFTENEGVKTAVLAIDDTNSPGTYDILYNIGDNGGTFTLTLDGSVRLARSGIFRITLSNELFDKTLGESAEAKFAELRNQIESLLGDKTYDTLPFKKPTYSGSLFQEYGTKVITNLEGSSDTHIFYSIGNVYEVGENSSVSASADGKVIYVGENDTLGRLIVLDHGCGVCTWYYGLSSIERSVGDEVSRGAVLGMSGINGYNGKSTLGFCMSAGSVFITPVFSD